MTDLIFEQQRAAALSVTCPYCHAAPGEPCADPRSRYVLERQIAHHRRIHLAQQSTRESR